MAEKVRHDFASFKLCSYVLLYESELSGASGEQLTEKTYRLLTRVDTWSGFSNHTAEDGTPTNANSLEAIDDDVHGTVGGGGHMSNTAYASRLLYVGGFLSNDSLD